ncbi:MAG: polysaccharide biosynthesis tyrosine autokinase [Lachnospiraceae bacterium]|jgi:capsular exopolysaccharide synthesis family protein|nr:polysaccharide biosynthesis tyrosine autokinase [Lachnospiraceae bacterium]
MKQIILEKLNDLDFQSNESYKALRTNIQFCGSDVKLLCFTSCLPDEGKSNVSFRLAASFAESGKRVIYVDADLRRSVTIGRYKPDQAVHGLTHFLSGMIPLEEILYETNVMNLDMIFTGPVPPNPSELLGSELFIKLIEMLREGYDYVIIDTPPLGNVIDSAIVAEHCDGVILVIEANAISYKLAQKVKKQLEKGGSRLLGAVLNKVPVKEGSYRYYGKKYNKYSKEYYRIY